MLPRMDSNHNSYVQSVMFYLPVRSDSEGWPLDIVAPYGFEPQLVGSEPTVLPLDDRASLIQNLALSPNRDDRALKFPYIIRQML